MNADRRSIEVTHRYLTTEQLQARWRGKRVIYNENCGRYGGWTGYEHFGLIQAYRYYGWRVTCWATVEAAAFGDASTSVFFDRLDDAVDVLKKLMDLAKRLGELACKPVQYAGYEFFGIKPWLPLEAGLRCIHDQMDTNPRAPTSPATWRHWIRRDPKRDDGRPLDPSLADRLGGKMWASYLNETLK
jgi:hypothetical protein